VVIAPIASANAPAQMNRILINMSLPFFSFAVMSGVWLGLELTGNTKAGFLGKENSSVCLMRALCATPPKPQSVAGRHKIHANYV